MITIAVKSCSTCPFQRVDEYLEFECTHPLTVGDRTVTDRAVVLPACPLKKELIRVKLVKNINQ